MHQLIHMATQLPGSLETSVLPTTLMVPLIQATLNDPIEAAASFGRWWLDAESSHWVLTNCAADFLGVAPGWHRLADATLVNVLSEDALMLSSMLTGAGKSSQPVECEFRVRKPLEGMRWLRMTSLPQPMNQDGALTGILIDITPEKHAAMRERFSFESTQHLVGAHTLGKAVTKVIQLACENLGWEWGAYWALESDAAGDAQLVCRHHWHSPCSAPMSFTEESYSITMKPGEGLIGHVWSTGKAAWIERMADDPGFLRQKSARESKLQSGYVFPVYYVSDDGQKHSPGVLEFFSRQPRQRDAQLPNLSAAISALIAQTAQRHEQQEYIRQLAQIDGLTGLANRHFFYQLLDEACSHAGMANKSFGVLFIDLDRFKPINDAFGHEAGNMVLREFGQRLRALAPDGCEVGRLGGDEFAILMNDIHSPAHLETLAERVLLAARTTYVFDDKLLSVSASVGISIYPEHGCSGPELLRSADTAMYRSKKEGRNGLSFFSAGLSQTALVQQLTLEAELHRALLDDEFFLEYQPIFGSDGEGIYAVEALIRWRRRNGEIVQPDMFIPIAEASGMSVQLGRWVVARACRDLAQMHRAGFRDLQVSVNMAAPEFINTDLPEQLAEVVAASGIAARHLCLELTEGMVMKQPEKVVVVMQALRQNGFNISLDDFGMGYSSLSWLKKLPITSLKIDRSFVRGLPFDRGDSAIVRTILDLGRHLKLQVIAEGVENDAQLAFLRQFGCTLVQGFLLGRPASLSDLIQLKPSL